jgi:hypothetical protein
LLICIKLIIFAPAKPGMADKGAAFATTFAEASVVKEGYGGHGEIAQLVRAHDS